jgi:hypothetical protein
MLRFRDPGGWLGLVGLFILTIGALGCPGNLDPSLAQGSSATGGADGGGTDSSGTATACSTSDQTQTVSQLCATVACHDATTVEAGLNLTPDATVGARLVGVKSQGTSGTGAGAADSLCTGFATPYLVAGSNPPTGLLINKITLAKGNAGLCPGGYPMPYPGTTPLTAAQTSCIESWAEGLIMAAGQ